MSEVKKVITVSDRSTKALINAVAGLDKVVGELSSLADSSAKLADEIEFKQSQLDNLNSEFENKFRESAANLRLRVLEDEEGVLLQLLQSRGLAHISASKVQDLQTQLEDAQTSNEIAVKEAVSKAQSDANREMNARLTAQESNHKVQVAELNANSKAKDDRIDLLTEQLEAARNDVKAERDTRLAIAQAEAQRQGVVVNAGK